MRASHILAMTVSVVLAAAGAGAVPAASADPSVDLSVRQAITTGGTEPYGLAASADGRSLFVGHFGSPAIQVVDTRTATVVASIPLAGDSGAVAVEPDGTLWAVQPDQHRIARVTDPLGSPTVVYFDAGAYPAGIALSADAATVYVVDENPAGSTGQVLALSTATGNLVHPSAVITGHPSGIGIAGDGSVWVGGDAGTVLSADLTAAVRIAGSGTFSGPPSFSPDGATAYVGQSATILVLDVATRAVARTISSTDAGCGSEYCPTLGAQITHLAVTPDGDTLYATSYDRPWRARIDLADDDASTLLPGPVDSGEDVDDTDLWQYSNEMLVVGDALWTASDGANYDGTIVERTPIAPTLQTVTASVSPGAQVTITGTALADAVVTVGGITSTVTSNDYGHVTFVVPTPASSGSYAVTLGTPSSTVPLAAGTLAITVPAVDAGTGGTTPGGTTGATTTGAGTTTTPTTGTTASAKLAKLKTAKPKIRGTVTVGRTLAITRGTWTKGTHFTYAWYANGKKIAHATKATLTLTTKLAGKKITVKVTGTRSGYTKATVTSKATKKVAKRR